MCSDAIAREKVRTMRAFGKVRTMRAFGADVEVLPSEGRLITPQLLARMQARVEKLAARGHVFRTKQFSVVVCGGPGKRVREEPDGGRDGHTATP